MAGSQHHTGVTQVVRGQQAKKAVLTPTSHPNILWSQQTVIKPPKVGKGGHSGVAG